ncbi:MAG: GNAT family N-acetyltransferase [Pseudomonadota bacterium]
MTEHTTRLVPIKTTLRNGDAVLIREVVPEDRDLMQLGFDRLSSESRYFRFLSPHNALTDAEVREFTATGDEEHLAIGAVMTSAAGVLPLGTARYVQLGPDDSRAEVAVTIIDSHQNIGLGSLLFGVLARLAATSGITEFIAIVHRNNTGMIHLLKGLGAKVSHREHAEIELVLPIFEQAEHYPDTPMGARVRAAYDLVNLDDHSLRLGSS